MAEDDAAGVGQDQCVLSKWDALVYNAFIKTSAKPRISLAASFSLANHFACTSERNPVVPA
jgi:hypothetical protein